MAILPIVLFNDPVLRRTADPVDAFTPELATFIDELFDTMYEANGIGLAAPQVGRSIRLFVVDADGMVEDEPDAPRYGKMAFINPVVTHAGSTKVEFEEGCLSIPDVRETVSRPDQITIRYLDATFTPKEETYSGWMSRVIQHELDHLDGVLFIDRVGSFKRRLLSRRLDLINQGLVEPDYVHVSRAHG